MRSTTCTRTVVPLVLCAAAFSGSAFAAEAASAHCDELAPTQHPVRPAGAPTGREFVKQIEGMSDDERESAILEQALSGNFPTFLRRADPVILSGRSAAGTPVTITLCVAPDYLAIGSDSDYLYVPMRLKTAIAVANRYNSVLPTPKIVDAIYEQARVHLQPQPLPAGNTMRTTGYYWHHSQLVREQRLSAGAPLGALTAGDKKDLVLTNRFWTHLARVAIYGWHHPDGQPIQPLSTVHGSRYADYSHGVRLVSAVADVDGVATPVLDLLQNPNLAPVLSDEGAIHNTRELLRILASQTLRTWNGCVSGMSGCRPPNQIKEVPIIREAQEPGRDLAAALAINLAHPFDEMLHQ
jgi:hypothetical protein